MCGGGGEKDVYPAPVRPLEWFLYTADVSVLYLLNQNKISQTSQTICSYSLNIGKNATEFLYGFKCVCYFSQRASVYDKFKDTRLSHQGGLESFCTSIQLTLAAWHQYRWVLFTLGDLSQRFIRRKQMMLWLTPCVPFALDVIFDGRNLAELHFLMRARPAQF